FPESDGALEPAVAHVRRLEEKHRRDPPAPISAVVTPREPSTLDPDLGAVAGADHRRRVHGADELDRLLEQRPVEGSRAFIPVQAAVSASDQRPLAARDDRFHPRPVLQFGIEQVLQARLAHAAQQQSLATYLTRLLSTNIRNG